MKYKLAKITADIQDCYTNRSSALLTFQTPSDGSHKTDFFFLYFVWQRKIWGIYMFAKTIVFEYKPAMTFTPAQDHQVELSISIIHQISCVPEIQSVCFLLYWYVCKRENYTNTFMRGRLWHTKTLSLLFSWNQILHWKNEIVYVNTKKFGFFFFCKSSFSGKKKEYLAF